MKPWGTNWNDHWKGYFIAHNDKEYINLISNINITTMAATKEDRMNGIKEPTDQCSPHYHWNLTMIKDLIDPTDKVKQVEVLY
jgi:hypothetical protein